MVLRQTKTKLYKYFRNVYSDQADEYVTNVDSLDIKQYTITGLFSS